MITYEVQINLASQVATPIIQAVQGDTGRSFSFVLSDFTIPDGATATYYVAKPSGEAVYNSATISGNSVICDMTAQSLAETGDNPMQIRILSGDEVVTSFEVILMVRKFYGEDAIESGSESNIFDQAVEAAAEDFQTQAEAIVAEVVESIPDDYTALSNEVDELNECLFNVRGDLNYNKTATPGYLLRATNSGNGTEWAEVGLPTDEQTAEAVSDWLDEHPEATTTVQNGSILYEHLSTTLQDMVDEIKFIPNFTVSNTANAPAKLPIITPIEGGNQPCHPKVLFLKNNFGGHYFWMAYTPYPASTDSLENPCIACSDDMINWDTPNGVTNPLDPTPSSGYNSDTHLVYREDLNRLEVWWRRYEGDSTTETIYRRTSVDGVNWESAELMYRLGSAESGFSNLLSPVLLYEDNKYKIWAGDGNPAGYLRYFESADGTNWQLIETTNLYGWHFDIIHETELYEAFISDTQPGGTVSYATSSDGITWSEKTQILTLGASGNWDSSRLYRTSAIKENGIYYVYYTGVHDNNWGVGLTISQVKNDITSLKGYVSGDASVTEKGKNYDSEIAELTQQIVSLQNRVLVIENMLYTIESITLDRDSATLDEDDTLQLTATIVPSSVPTSLIDWSSSASGVASVDSSGLVTALGAGTATITCSAKEDASVYDECIITVRGVINILKNLSTHSGYVNATNGTIGTSATDIYFDNAIIEGYSHIFVVYDDLDTNLKKQSAKVVFYDSSETFISGYYNALTFYEAVPSNAKYLRLGCSTTATSAEVYNTLNIQIDFTTAQANKYYDAIDGSIKNQNNLSCVKVPISSANCYVRGAISGALFDANDNYVSGLSYNLSAPDRVVDTSTAAYIGVNYQTANVGNVAIVSQNERIGNWEAS